MTPPYSLPAEQRELSRTVSKYQVSPSQDPLKRTQQTGEVFG